MLSDGDQQESAKVLARWLIQTCGRSGSWESIERIANDHTGPDWIPADVAMALYADHADMLDVLIFSYHRDDPLVHALNQVVREMVREDPAHPTCAEAVRAHVGHAMIHLAGTLVSMRSMAADCERWLAEASRG